MVVGLEAVGEAVSVPEAAFETRESSPQLEASRPPASTNTINR